MTMAYLVSMKSKDPSTRVGAVIVGQNREIISTGYNGLPRGIADRNYRYEDREYKLLAVNHAEENAILHCALNGVSAKEASLYVPWLPCSRCTKFIIQAGIKEVVYDTNFPGNIEGLEGDWKRSLDIAREMLSEVNIITRGFSGKLIHVEGLFKGQTFPIISTATPSQNGH